MLIHMGPRESRVRNSTTLQEFITYLNTNQKQSKNFENEHMIFCGCLGTDHLTTNAVSCTGLLYRFCNFKVHYILFSNMIAIS